MQLKIRRFSLEIIPETAQDEAFLEEVLGLKDDLSWVKLKRYNSLGMSCWGQAEARKMQPHDTEAS